MSGNQDFLRAPVYRFFVSPDSKLNDQQSLQLVNMLLSLKKVAFQILARPGAIVWEAIDLSGNKKHLLSGFYDVQVEYDFWEGHWGKVYPCYRYVAPYGLKLFDDKPITYITDLYQDADPLVPVAQVMSNLLDFEEVRFTLYVGRTHRRGSLKDLLILTTILTGGELPKRYYQTDRDRLIKHKASQEQYRTSISVEVTSPDINRVKYLSQALTSVLNNFDRTTPNHPSNGLRGLDWDSNNIIPLNNFQDDANKNVLAMCEDSLTSKQAAKDIDQASVNLTAAEIAALWHLPHQGFQQTQVFWAKKVVQVSDLIARSTQGVVLGEGIYQGKRIPVRLAPPDQLTHTSIIGKPGYGKSTLLLNLARQKIQGGCGVAVIDPHGTLIQSILQGNIPREREADVVVVDLADLEHPAPLNLLRGEKDETRIELLANALSNLFPDMDQLVQTSRYLTAALSTVQFDSDATIRDIGRLFKDDVYRGQLLRQLKPLEHVQALEAWQDYEAPEKKKAQGRQAIYEPILNRISPFYSKPYILPILCHPKGLDFTTLIKQQKIILISLKMHKRATDQERDLIGALLISILQAAGMQETHAPFFIYVDEAEKFVTSSLSTLLAEARKDNLFLTLANQFTQQLSGETLQAIGGTVATNICFNCGVDDARKVKDIFAPHFEITDLINLDQFQAAVKIRYEGLAQHAFSLYTLPPPNHGLTPEQALATEQRIRARSISQYTPMSGEEVTQWLETRYRIDDEDPRYG